MPADSFRLGVPPATRPRVPTSGPPVVGSSSFANERRTAVVSIAVRVPHAGGHSEPESPWLVDESDATGRGKLSRMTKALQQLHPLVFLLIATTLEVSGDALIRKAMFEHVGLARIGLMLGGTALLFGYGSSLNLAPLEFGQVVGLYIATLFVVWQVINAVAFRSWPTTPIVVGGALIIAGGLIVTFWAPNNAAH